MQFFSPHTLGPFDIREDQLSKALSNGHNLQWRIREGRGFLEDSRIWIPHTSTVPVSKKPKVSQRHNDD